jgi:hypothetical protein
MAVNEFLQFANEITANVPTQVEWASYPILANGVQPGIADGKAANKLWRQGATWGNVLGSFITEKTGNDALDNGLSLDLLNNFSLAINLNSLEKSSKVK